MRSRKRKFWDLLIVLVCVLAALAVWLGFGKQGLIRLYREEMKRQACLDRIRQLAEENQDLIEEIKRIRTDKKYLEAVARKELGLVKKNDVIYRFHSDKASNHKFTAAPIQPDQKLEKTDRLSEREVLHHEENR